MDILVTGATGFIGKTLCAYFAKKGHHVYAMARKSSVYKLINIKDIEIVPIDISSPQSVSAEIPKADALLHLAGIFREFKGSGQTFGAANFMTTKHALSIAEKIGAGKFIFLSSVGASPESNVKFLRSKFLCEELIKNFPLDYLILRTPLVYGKGDNSTGHFLDLVKMSVVPVIGNRRKKIRPLFVDDLARAIGNALEKETLSRRTLDLEGPESLTYREMLETVARLQKRNPGFLNVPQAPLRVVTKMLERFSFYPVSFDQLAMMDEDTVKSEDYLNYYSASLKSYEEGIKEITKERNTN